MDRLAGLVVHHLQPISCVATAKRGSRQGGGWVLSVRAVLQCRFYGIRLPQSNRQGSLEQQQHSRTLEDDRADHGPAGWIAEVKGRPHPRPSIHSFLSGHGRPMVLLPVQVGRVPKHNRPCSHQQRYHPSSHPQHITTAITITTIITSNTNVYEERRPSFPAERISRTGNVAAPEEPQEPWSAV